MKAELYFSWVYFHESRIFTKPTMPQHHHATLDQLLKQLMDPSIREIGGTR
jgi:hypothetical protein